MFRRFLVQACILAFALASACQAVGAPMQAHGTGEITLAGIGKGSVELRDGWRFHTGDDPGWCRPELDDAHWQTIQPTASWGNQGHPSYTGFAWYRDRIRIQAGPGENGQYSILIPQAEDAYEVYWNCRLIGSYGKMPPHPSWHYSIFPRSFELSGPPSGVLAIRFWKAPLDAFATDSLGGLYFAPVIGASSVISLKQDWFTWKQVRAQLFDYSLILLRVFIAALCIILWARKRGEQLFLWVAIFTIIPVARGTLENLFLIPFSYPLARFINQPLYVLSSVSLWFLLLWLLELHDDPRLRKLTVVLSWIAMGIGFADGLLALFWAYAGPLMQCVDGVLLACIFVLQNYAFVLVAIGIRRKHHISRVAVALAAFVLQMYQFFADLTALGQRFTHWSLYNRLIDAPLLTIQGVQFTAGKLISLALFAAILYALYRYIVEQQSRRAALEQEMQSAREIQRVLMPEAVPAIEGFALTSAYVPAQEVGGDFFQIFPVADGSSIVALGDVSGKGLKAAMNVSMIVGALRAQSANTTSPAAILEALNHCLVGRMSGGFATSLVFRLESDGTLVLGNAGHLPPYLNGQEFPIEPSLPLGMVAENNYKEVTLQLNPGDELVFYTDGLVEARDETGQLYGFDRLRILLALRPTAQKASERAVEFGQQDDITILTLTRLAAGEQSSASVTAPIFEPVART